MGENERKKQTHKERLLQSSDADFTGEDMVVPHWMAEGNLYRCPGLELVHSCWPANILPDTGRCMLVNGNTEGVLELRCNRLITGTHAMQV